MTKHGSPLTMGVEAIFILGKTNAANLVTVVQDSSFPCGTSKRLYVGVFLPQVLLEGTTVLMSCCPRECAKFAWSRTRRCFLTVSLLKIFQWVRRAPPRAYSGSHRSSWVLSFPLGISSSQLLSDHFRIDKSWVDDPGGTLLRRVLRRCPAVEDVWRRNEFCVGATLFGDGAVRRCWSLRKNSASREKSACSVLIIWPELEE